jgi:hypothetical protein
MSSLLSDQDNVLDGFTESIMDFFGGEDYLLTYSSPRTGLMMKLMDSPKRLTVTNGLESPPQPSVITPPGGEIMATGPSNIGRVVTPPMKKRVRKEDELMQPTNNDATKMMTMEPMMVSTKSLAEYPFSLIQNKANTIQTNSMDANKSFVMQAKDMMSAIPAGGTTNIKDLNKKRVMTKQTAPIKPRKNARMTTSKSPTSSPSSIAAATTTKPTTPTPTFSAIVTPSNAALSTAVKGKLTTMEAIRKDGTKPSSPVTGGAETGKKPVQKLNAKERRK